MPSIPFERANTSRKSPSRTAPVPPLDNHKTCQIQISASSAQSLDKWELYDFFKKYSSLKSTRMCGVLGYPCLHWQCPRCSPKRQKRFRSRLRAAVRNTTVGTAISVTLTVSSTPSRPLAATWGDLDKLRQYLSSGDWLGRRVDGFAWVTEVTYSAEGGWHPHIHMILVSENSLTTAQTAKLSREIRERWQKGARMRGIDADLPGQHVAVLDSTTAVLKWITYMTKEHTEHAPDDPGTLTPGDILAAAARGDADALDLHHELETASARRRMRDTSGVFRGQPDR